MRPVHISETQDGHWLRAPYKRVRRISLPGVLISIPSGMILSVSGRRVAGLRPCVGSVTHLRPCARAFHAQLAVRKGLVRGVGTSFRAIVVSSQRKIKAAWKAGSQRAVERCRWSEVEAGTCAVMCRDGVASGAVFGWRRNHPIAHNSPNPPHKPVAPQDFSQVRGTTSLRTYTAYVGEPFHPRLRRWPNGHPIPTSGTQVPYS